MAILAETLFSCSLQGVEEEQPSNLDLTPVNLNIVETNDNVAQRKTIQQIALEMPFEETFVAFEDTEMKLSIQLHFIDSTAIVEKVDFTLENKSGPFGYELGEVTSCQNEEIGVFYRINLIENNGASSVHSLTENINLAKGNHALFLFNGFKSTEEGYYNDHPCEFNRTCPRSKDGYIIISI